MGVVSKPNTFSPNTTISSSQMNANFDTLYNEFNGNIANANISASADINGSKLADGTVDTLQLAPGSVTGEKIGTPIAFSVYASASQTISPATFTKIQMDTEEFDLGGNFDNSTNYRFVAPYNGVYFLTASVEFNSSGVDAASRVQAVLYKNGSIVKQGISAVSGASEQRISSIVGVHLSLSASDYIEVYAFHGDSGTLDTEPESDETYFSGQLVGRT